MRNVSKKRDAGKATNPINFKEEMLVAREFKWSSPNKRARKYADDRKAKVHTKGPKEGKPLSDYEAGMRSGYLQCRSDSASLYKYKEAITKALAEGKSQKEAKKIAAQAATTKWSKKTA